MSGQVSHGTSDLQHHAGFCRIGIELYARLFERFSVRFSDMQATQLLSELRVTSSRRDIAIEIQGVRGRIKPIFEKYESDRS